MEGTEENKTIPTWLIWGKILMESLGIILKSYQGMFQKRFAQIIQWVSHLGSPHPVLKLQPSEFLDDWPMMMDGWTTPQSVMMMEKRRLWRCWSDKFDSILNSFSFGDWQGNRWQGDFWNLVIHLAGPRLSCTPLHKALPKPKSRGFRLQRHTDWHISN